MVMPVKLMGNTITTLVSIFPFYHYLEIAQNISNNTLSDVTFISYIVISIYLIVIILLAIITFKNKVEQEK
jgi:ABC-type polysaccharide/polyol phosphate export permease